MFKPLPKADKVDYQWTPARARQLTNAFQRLLRKEQVPGWVWLTDQQFEEVGLLRREHHLVHTHRTKHDVDKLNAFLEPLGTDQFLQAVIYQLEPHVKDMTAEMRRVTGDGTQLIFSTPPQVFVQPMAFRLFLSAWLHWRPACPHGDVK